MSPLWPKTGFSTFWRLLWHFVQLKRIFDLRSTNPLFDGRWDFRFFQSKTRFLHFLSKPSQVPSGHKLYLSTHFWYPQAIYHIFTPVFIIFHTFFNALDKLLKPLHDPFGQKQTRFWTFFWPIFWPQKWSFLRLSCFWHFSNIQNMSQKRLKITLKNIQKHQKTRFWPLRYPPGPFLDP